MKKRWIILALLAFTILNVTNAQVSFGEAEKFNSDWLFSLSDDTKYADKDLNDQRWRKLNLPHDWSVEHPMSPNLASCTGFLPGGIAWYRKHFTIDDLTSRHYIYFEGVYNRSEVYLNGHLLGKRPNGYISFMYDLTPYLTEGENVMAVRVDHSRYADSRWYTGSGIYRDVYLITAGETHFAQWGIGWYATQITDKKAIVAVDMEVEKHGKNAETLTLVARLLDKDGNLVSTSKKKISMKEPGTQKNTLQLTVKNPKRWDLNNPYLYSLETELISNGQRIDQSSANVGLRTLDFDANKGFALNGNSMKVKGVCLHHDAGVLGAAVPYEVWERRLKNLKAIGVNAIRMSHNPQSPCVYDICDQIGLLVMDEASDEWEFPKRKWVQGWNKGTPSFDGTFDFFEEWIERDVTDMVRRDRNHPSIFLWSIGNEVDYPNDPYSHPILDGSTISQPMFGGYDPKAPSAMRIGEIAKRLVACVKSVDTSRPTTGALAGVVMSNETAYPEAVDIVGYNYTEDRYDKDHDTYPNRIIYGSENRADLQAWRDVENRDFIFGQFIWTGTDYLGESGGWPGRGFYTGLLDFASFPKARGHFRASLWCETPVTYIGTYPIYTARQGQGQRQRGANLSSDAQDNWNYREGQNIRVVCYTNSPQAKLMLNGKEVGEMKPYEKRSGIIHWDIPYEAGELKCIGCDANGKAESEYTIKTCGRPYALRVSADKTKLSANRGTAHVFIEVVDENGNLVYLADNNITCRVQGPARLLGLENCDNNDISSLTDNQQRAYRGKLLAYVQTTGNEGDIRISFTSPLLEGAEITLTAE